MLTARQISADLAVSATTLTAVLAACPEELDRHVADRTAAGRPAWHTQSQLDCADLVPVLVAEINALVGSTLRAVRAHVITAPAHRLAAYEAVDLASRRAFDAARLVRAGDDGIPAAAHP